MRLDHLAIGAQTLQEGVAWAEAKLGVSFQAGGTHARFATHNRLLGVADGLYLEVIAADPDATCEGPRWFGLDTFSGPPRLVNWICEPADFDAALRHGLEKVPMRRDALKWDMGVRPDGTLPLGGAYPTVLKWNTSSPPGRSLPNSGIALHRLVIEHPHAADIQAEVAELNDPRVEFHVAAAPNLRATFDTPTGRVTL